jgi:uncharacterized protein with HEPN domain
MLEAISLARAFTEGMDKQTFLDDKRTQQAVILNLLTLGEAAAHIARLYPEFSAQHPQLPWKQMRGMRNRMAHGYFDINLDIVWETICNDLPTLEATLHAVIESGSGR